MRDHARVLSVAAAEAVGEPDTIARRPEVLDTLAHLAADSGFRDAVERVMPGGLRDPRVDLAGLANALAPYQSRHLDDAPDLVEWLGFVAWLVGEVERQDQPTSDSPALTAV